MLDEGLLQESDWTGDLRSSVNGGIGRWVSGLLGGLPLPRIRIGLEWRNRLPAPLQPDLWVQAAPGRTADQPVGLLAIRTAEPTELFLGAKVRELEEVRPGVGFQVFALIADVLPPLIGASTPHYAYRELEKYELIRRVRYDTSAWIGGGLVGGFTRADLLQHVPLEACEGEFRPGVLKEALRHPLPPWAEMIVREAADLHAMRSVSRETYRCDLHLLHRPPVHFVFMPGFAPKWASFVLRWCPEDVVGTVAADYRRQMQAMEDEHGPGTVSNLAWCQAWQAHNGRELRKTVRAWKNAVTLALRGCRLAELLHTESPS